MNQPQITRRILTTGEHQVIMELRWFALAGSYLVEASRNRHLTRGRRNLGMAASRPGPCSVEHDQRGGSGVKQLKTHVWDREANEHYVEPFWTSKRLFEEEEFHGQIWDPCCGFGRITESAVQHGHKHGYASDTINRGYSGLNEIIDFLKCTDHQASPNIVCNPPFNIANEFALHALSLRATEKVAMIFPTARLNAAHWLQGTPLARVWLMTPRPSMPPWHTITAGLKPGGGKSDFCWLVWERGFEGATEIKWLRRDGQARAKLNEVTAAEVVS